MEKAEALGLEFDETFLAHYQPCFNSVLHDSMGPLYRLMGPLIRPIGGHTGHGEVVHQSAIDRLQLASCGYDPANLRAYLQDAAPARIGNTTRVARGSPCR